MKYSFYLFLFYLCFDVDVSLSLKKGFFSLHVIIFIGEIMLIRLKLYCVQLGKIIEGNLMKMIRSNNDDNSIQFVKRKLFYNYSSTRLTQNF